MFDIFLTDEAGEQLERLTKNYIIKATLSVIPALYRVRGKLQPVSSDVAFKVAGFRVKPGMTAMRLY